MAAVLSFLRIPVKNRSPPAPGCGVQHFGGRVEQGIADGSGHVAAALAAHGHDGGYAKGFAGGKQPLLALHHIHEPHRYANDQCRTQPGFDLVGDGQQGGGGVDTASTAPGCSCAARCMEATARVVPPALARAATSGSAM